MIYVGYQGVGKSSIAGKNNCIDLESSNFFVGQYRVDDWEKIYCNIAEHLSNQGYNVFMSSHKVVREELAKRKIPYTIIAPSPDLKEEWIKRLQERYNNTHLEKDYKALMNAKDCYEQNVLDLINDDGAFSEITIFNIDYDLMNIL